MWIKCTSHTRTKDTKSQLYTCACWKWETQRIDSRKKLEINYETKKNFLTPARFLRGCHAKKRVLNRFFGIRDFPHLKLGIRDFKAKSERDLGLKVCAGGGMPKITRVGITEVKNLIGDPLRMKACFLRVSITDPPSLAGLENFILTHIFLTQCFPILLLYKNTELVHTAVIQLNFRWH